MACCHGRALHVLKERQQCRSYLAAAGYLPIPEVFSPMPTARSTLQQLPINN